MADIAALATLIDSDPTLDAAVRAGRNGELVALLNADVAGTKRWNDVRVDDFLDAIALETLTAAQENRIQTYTNNRELIPSSKPNVRSWIQAQGFAPATITALRALAERDPTFVEESPVGEAVTLQDVRKAVRRVAKSHIISTGQAVLET